MIHLRLQVHADGIPPKLLKEMVFELSPSLTLLH